MHEFSDLAYEEKTSQKKETLPTLFMNGREPGVLEGFYKGKLELLIPQSPLEYIAFFLTKLYLPWKGKEFFGTRASGINILPSHTKLLTKSLVPNAVGTLSSGGYQAFPFKTMTTKGITDPINVTRLDYDLPENPPLVRRVIDEIVETEDGNYLGKAHIKTSAGTRLIAYFRLLSSID